MTMTRRRRSVLYIPATNLRAIDKAGIHLPMRSFSTWKTPLRRSKRSWLVIVRI
jgi:hypothetical protein